MSRRLTLESLSSLTVAFEDDIPDGKSRKEIEYEIYAKITDRSVLDALRKVHIEQWTINLEDRRGSLRVRKTLDGSAIEYTQTLKLRIASSEGPKECLENTVKCSVDFYNMFAAMATNGLIKDRYYCEIKDTEYKWEIDLMYGSDGVISDIVKFDLEVPEPLDVLPDLPSGFETVIKNQFGQRTDEEIKMISEWLKQWSHQTTPAANT